VLLQYLVTLSLGDGFIPNEVWEEVKSTFCFQEMNDAEWKWCLAFITHGGLSLQAYPDYHKVKVEDGVYKIANQRLARRHRLSIGAIVGDTMIAVKMNRGGLVGHVEESFVASLNEGDTFWFAGQGWQLIRVKELTAFVKKSDKKTGKIPSYQGGRLPLSSKMSDMLRFKLNEAMEFGEKSKDLELRAIQPILKLQQERSHVPRNNEFLVEVFESKDGHHALFYGFEGRFVHEGLASLFAWRIGQYQPISFSLAYNDYGFELLSDQPFDVEMAIEKGLFNAENLQRDLFASVNSTELARRRFREIAAIAGLIFKGYPGQQIKDRHIQSSAQLIFNVLEDYEKDHLLLRQAYDEVIQFQLEIDRLRAALQRIKAQDVLVATPDRPTPFAFPIMVDRLREKMSTESLEDRVKRMVLDLEG
jgi:ATP-dependent Lhr-like helicase